MKKLMITTITALGLLLLMSGIALGNAFTLQAENGKILAPAGLGLELNGMYQNKNSSGQTASTLYDTQLSYGITPAITIAGEFKGDYKSGINSSPTIIKALFSPTTKGNSYTLYADYDLNHATVQLYGISLWAATKYLYTFANLEERNATEGLPSSLVITPGINLKIGSKIGVGGEVEFNAEDLSGQELRVGLNYYLNPKIAAKFTFETGLANQPDRIYKTGLAVEI
jgi:hypothetical protein